MLNSVLRNPICKVFFAGFQSDTYTLQRNGWQLSMEQLLDRSELRLALRHEGARLHALSNPVSYYAFEMAKNPAYYEKIEFHIRWMGSDARFQIFPETRMSSFRAVDAEPFFEERQPREYRFEELIPFRPINSDAPEIVVPPSSVPELMEMILRLQDPKQKEIREAQRKASWRERHASEGLGYNPAADIKAQIITLAG